MLLGVPAPEPDPEVPPAAEPDPLPLMLSLEPLGLLLELLELPGAVVAPGRVELPGLVGLDDGEADFDDEPDDDPVVLSGLRSHAATANAAATAAARVRY